jgi:hypothetical protein
MDLRSSLSSNLGEFLIMDLWTRCCCGLYRSDELTCVLDFMRAFFSDLLKCGRLLSKIGGSGQG